MELLPYFKEAEGKETKMLIVVTGGSGSGKSAFAEGIIMEASEKMPRIYLATMEVYDKEGRKKVERHRLLRKGKGFETLECPKGLFNAADQMKEGSAVLLECMSNLTANELFSEVVKPSLEAVKERILSGILCIAKKAELFVIVTNNVFEDGICYELSTMEYLSVLAQINEKLAGMADQFIEVTAGIPTYFNRKKEAQKGENGMEFYFGGFGQGKLQYVKKLHADAGYEVIDGAELSTKEGQLEKQLEKKQQLILNHFQIWVKRCLLEKVDPEPLLKGMLQKKQKLIIICDEIGNGIVPVDALEREYREKVGRLQCQIAAQAERAERILCGMGQRLK